VLKPVNISIYGRRKSKVCKIWRFSITIGEDASVGQSERTEVTQQMTSNVVC